METRTFFIMDSSAESGYNHDYDVTVENTYTGTVYTMYYSKNHYWDESVRGEEVMSITDHGNGFSITPEVNREMDYSEMGQLFALLSFINSQEKFGLYQGDIIQKTNIKSI